MKEKNQMDIKFILSWIFLCCSLYIHAQMPANVDRHNEVVLRLMGHEILKNAGDSVSRVLPIMNKDTQFVLNFDTRFAIKPEELVSKVDVIVDQYDFARHYILEVKNKLTGQTVYSYERNTLDHNEIVPCQSRPLPEETYEIVFNILDNDDSEPEQVTQTQTGSIGDTNQFNWWYLSLLCLPVILGFIFFKSNDKTIQDPMPERVQIGQALFDESRLKLIRDNLSVELTGKEALLLKILFDHVNETVDKQKILHEVWDDEGEYVGRTLDVFISKLRKKLEIEPDLKIINIRGIGYRLVLG